MTKGLLHLQVVVVVMVVRRRRRTYLLKKKKTRRRRRRLMTRSLPLYQYVPTTRRNDVRDTPEGSSLRQSCKC